MSPESRRRSYLNQTKLEAVDTFKEAPRIGNAGADMSMLVSNNAVTGNIKDAGKVSRRERLNTESTSSDLLS